MITNAVINTRSHDTMISQLLNGESPPTNIVHASAQFSKGEHLYMSSDHADYIYFLKNGNVKLSKIIETGEEQLSFIIGPGEVFGKNILMNQNKDEESAVALNDCTVEYIDIESWNNLMRHDPQFMLNVLKVVGARIHSLEVRIEQMQYMSTTQRIKAILHGLAEQFGVRNNTKKTVTLNLQLTHKDISKLAGTSRQSVTTTLRKLQSENILQYNRNNMLITDFDKIKK